MCCCFQVTKTGSVTTAFLSFTNISSEEEGSYTCLKYFPGPRIATNTITVTVNKSKINFAVCFREVYMYNVIFQVLSVLDFYRI